MNNKLEYSVKYVKGVGPKRAEAFAKLGIENVYDLLEYCPRDYVDLSCTCEIKDTAANDELSVAIRGRIVKKLPPARIRKGMVICKAVFTDDTDDLTLTLYNQEYLFGSLKEGAEYILYGKVSGNMVRREMNAPQIFSADTPDLMIPVYPLTEGLSQKMIRAAVKNALGLVDDENTEIFPEWIIEQLGLCGLAQAWRGVHFPKDWKEAQTARRRLTFDELFVHSLAIAKRREADRESAHYKMKRVPIDELLNALPYQLTDGQRQALDDCIDGMCSSYRMNRLIQGDVGSGKTAVAAGAAWYAFKNGYQSCIMAPTEILAQQHYESFCAMLEPLGVRVGLLTGSLTPKNKREMQQKIADGEYDVVVGTHALFSERTQFLKLALVVADEQHRFGVNQRAALSAKGIGPHSIVMSATPIPRTLALILYGSMEISQMHDMPHGEKKISTYAVTGKLRERAYSFVKKQLDMGFQGYIICPAVEESELEIFDVKSYFENISRGEFKDYSIGLLHGKMSAQEKDSAMKAFKDGEIQLLVATTVVEVGVDVPNATIMLIENADRFGLSQLHQLRGRVGRNGEQAYCILVTDNRSDECVKRMKTISSTTDGFKIAEEDLLQRGPGEYFGRQQHGLPSFKIADLSRDAELLKLAQRLSEEIIKEDSQLAQPKNKRLKELADRLIAKGADLV